MVTRAVIFDFYGTLAATFTERATGACGDMEQTMHWLAERCGHTVTTDQVAAACDARRTTEEVYTRALRPDAEPTLRALRARGLKIGLLSDCTHELPEIWPSLPVASYVDATLFSLQAGFRKPHPELYATVARLLEVAPAECLYVGDGGSSELTGAALAGMTPFHLVTTDAQDAVIYDADKLWTGATISSLRELLDYRGLVQSKT